MALLMLGDFIFELRTAPFQQRQRSTQQRWAANNRVGLPPAHQYVGPGDDTLTLSGVLYHEVTGHAPDVEALRVLAAKGEPQLMVDDGGYLRGWWIVEGVDETGSEFFADGTPRKLEFTVHLKRTDRPIVGQPRM
ncbi:phage tail protein [Methylocaldum sp. MU1018]